MKNTAIKNTPFFDCCIGNYGFTLIEVLAAALILFTALTVAAISYNTSLNFVGRTQAIARISCEVHDIQKRIKNGLEAGQMKGTDRLNADISYAWQARQEKSSLNILSGYDEYTDGILYGNIQLHLFQVELTISLQGYGKSHQSYYDYMELTWNRQQTS